VSNEIENDDESGDLLAKLRETRAEAKSRRLQVKSLEQQFGSLLELPEQDRDAILEFADHYRSGRSVDAVSWMETNLPIIGGDDYQFPGTPEENPADEPEAEADEEMAKTDEEIDALIERRVEERINARFEAQDKHAAEAAAVEREAEKVRSQAAKLGYAVKKGEAGFAKFRVLMGYAEEIEGDQTNAEKIAAAHQQMLDEGVAPVSAADAEDSAVEMTEPQPDVTGAPPDGEAPSGQRPTGTPAERAMARLERQEEAGLV